MNDNQRTVLGYLTVENLGKEHFGDTFIDLQNGVETIPNNVYEAYIALTDKQFFEVVKTHISYKLNSGM